MDFELASPWEFKFALLMQTLITFYLRYSMNQSLVWKKANHSSSPVESSVLPVPY
jgi:hypothetical protein